jgi:hypothetical protein
VEGETLKKETPRIPESNLLFLQKKHKKKTTPCMITHDKAFSPWDN